MQTEEHQADNKRLMAEKHAEAVDCKSRSKQPQAEASSRKQAKASSCNYCRKQAPEAVQVCGKLAYLRGLGGPAAEAVRVRVWVGQDSGKQIDD